MSTTTPDRFSLSRTAHLTRWNTVLLGRNRLAFAYGVALPLTPLLMLFAGDRGSEGLGSTAIVTVTMIAGLFPVYYNVLSQFVSRRDELVLKRMRTGEVRDSELVAGIALPGVGTAMAMSAIAVPIAVAIGQPLPVNAALYAGGLALVFVMFAAFAYWTAGWTKSAEAAQLTSLPVILLASIGPLAGSLPTMSDTLRDILALTPGAALSDLVRVGWHGFDGPTASDATLSFAETWGAAVQPGVVLVVWTVLAIELARRSLRWEPRA